MTVGGNMSACCSNGSEHVFIGRDSGSSETCEPPDLVDHNNEDWLHRLTVPEAEQLWRQLGYALGHSHSVAEE